MGALGAEPAVDPRRVARGAVTVMLQDQRILACRQSAGQFLGRLTGGGAAASAVEVEELEDHKPRVAARHGTLRPGQGRRPRSEQDGDPYHGR